MTKHPYLTRLKMKVNSVGITKNGYSGSSKDLCKSTEVDCLLKYSVTIG